MIASTAGLYLRTSGLESPLKTRHAQVVSTIFVKSIQKRDSFHLNRSLVQLARLTCPELLGQSSAAKAALVHALWTELGRLLSGTCANATTWRSSSSNGEGRGQSPAGAFSMARNGTGSLGRLCLKRLWRSCMDEIINEKPALQLSISI